VRREASVTVADRGVVDHPLWRLPLFCVLAPMLGVVPLGIARGALAEITRQIHQGSESSRSGIADDPLAIADYGMADARLRAATAGLFDAIGRVWDLAEQGAPVPTDVQGRLMTSMNYGAEVAVEVTSIAHRLGGGPAAFTAHYLSRALRDVQTARQHIMFGHLHRPMLGQAVAGLPVFSPPFIV
jgi:alkylation response protein AidB-like acyl-CoA dehydrogenase